MTKKALCLSGGATRGGFQMGAIIFLYESYGFRPDIISGTSIGAVNGIKLACGPPPAVNDTEAILTEVMHGNIDPQLMHMRELEQIWLDVNGRKDFFAITPAFQGTMVEDALADNSSSSPLPSSDLILAANIGMYLPFFHLISGIASSVELSKIQSLLKTVMQEDSVADLSPVKTKLTKPGRINVGKAADTPPYTNNLFFGTPLYMAMVSLETGKLRYMTNKAEFYERDGVTPVATALSTMDIDAALDENLAPLPKQRSDNIKFVVSKYQAAVNAIASYIPELNNDGTSVPRKAELAALTERARQRGIYWSRAAYEQIKGITIKTIVLDPMTNLPDPIIGAIASASLPVLLAPQVIGVERYIDGGLREIIPIDIVLNKGVTEIVGILCSTQEPVEADSMQKAGLIACGMKALTEIAIDEITVGDLVGASASGIKTTIIAPEIDVYSGFDLEPSLVEIGMHYGWMRAEDEMQPIAPGADRRVFRQSSQLITRLRMRCLDLERDIPGGSIKQKIEDRVKSDYFQLRVIRWAIMYLAAKRQALGLPPHPNRINWTTDWEREFRDRPSIWSAIDVTISGEQLDFHTTFWPASSPFTFNPDIGTLEDAGSDRIYWMVRGAIFEDKSGTPPADPSLNVVVPNGLHQFLPRIPQGSHIMAEKQAPGTIFLVIGGKKYASPTPQWISAAGLTGATTAIVPQGGLAQIPDGGIPYFLGSLTVVNDQDVALPEVTVERLEQSNTTVDIRVHNRSTTTLTNVSIVPTGFAAAQGITVEYAPTSIGPNTIDLFILRLRPTAAGDFSGSLQINSSDPLMPQIVVGMKFKVLPLGSMDDLHAAPSPLTINGSVNSTTTYATLTLTNQGTVTPSSISATFDPPGMPPLFQTGINLSAASFSPGKPVSLPIFFYPTAAGTFNADLVLKTSGKTSQNNPYERTVRVPLVGVAGASTIRLLARTPTPDDFDPIVRRPFPPRRDIPRTAITVNLGTIQPPVNNVTSVFILNTGTLQLEIPTMLGYYASPTSSQAFPIKIDPGKWLEVKLDFGIYRAPGIGAFSEILRILNNDPITPEAQVTLTGSVGGAKGDIRPEFIDFGTVGLNTAVQRTTVFENKGTVDLHINKIAWRNNPTDFRLVAPPTLPYTLPAGQNLTLTVEFGPVANSGGFFGDYLAMGTTEGIVGNLGVQAKT